MDFYKSEENKTAFVNTVMTEELRDKLEQMAHADDLDRSKLIRRLILKEWVRRQRAKAKGAAIGVTMKR